MQVPEIPNVVSTSQTETVPISLANAMLPPTPVRKVAEIKERLKQIKSQLIDSDIVHYATYNAAGKHNEVYLTSKLYRQSSRAGEWGSSHFCSTLRNTAYGFDEGYARSMSHRDGIFVVDRHFVPPNEMQRKLFDRFLDKPDPLVALICNRFDISFDDLLPIRVVGHHLRLLGVLLKRAETNNIVLVDIDKKKQR